MFRSKQSNQHRLKTGITFDTNTITKVFKNQPLPKSGSFTDPFFPPNMNSILGKNENGEFIDKEDGPTRASWFKEEDIEWKRASEIFPTQFLFEGEICVDDIKQGKIGNCYFLSAIAGLSEYPNLITQVFITKEVSKDGFYKILVWIEGEYQIVYVDDFFPVVKGTNVLYFAKPNSYELWAILLEKVWAKINGGYSNIIAGWPCDVFRAFTGFAGEELIHNDIEIDKLWGILEFVDKADGIICASTRNSDELSKFGLIKNHAYTWIDVEEITQDNGEKERIVLLRNPWGYKEWNGNWSDTSNLWTDKIKSQIGSQYINKDDGSFWMSIADFQKHFLRTDICQIIYGANVTVLSKKRETFNEMNLYNIHMKSEGLFTISIMEDNWRYNRIHKDKSHPTSLVLCQYDPIKHEIMDVHTDFECYQDTEKTRLLSAGFYLLWVYKAYDIYEGTIPNDVKIKFSSSSDYLIYNVPEKDPEFTVIKRILAENIKKQQKDKIKDNEMFYELRNEFKSSGLAYRIVVNPFENRYQEWENNPTEIEGITWLHPYKNDTKFSFKVDPKSYFIILGIKNDIYGSHWFNWSSKVKTFESSKVKPGQPEDLSKYFFDFKGKEKECSNYTYKTSTFDVLSKKVKYPVIDHNAIGFQKLQKDYPMMMTPLLELKEVEDRKNDLSWVYLQKPNGFYVGQARYTTRHGRGAYHFTDDGTTWIGYWNENAKGDYGKLYDKGGNLLYDGQYKDGKRHGKGIMRFTSGEKYEGDFVNNTREGLGVFSWPDGSKWEGPFKNNEMNGKGMFIDNDDSWEVTYKNGEIVE